ncbi:MAG: Smr/MutS family protein [Rhodobacteraceae bacterium]|nr:Smr/MutS family protein [Paracoccaceae bacterium]
MIRKPRSLTAEERALWDKVIRRMDRVERAATVAPRANPTGKPDPKPDMNPFITGSKAEPKLMDPTPPGFVNRPSVPYPGMDRRNFRRLVKNRFEIDGILDLHGLTADQAQQRLGRFVLNAHATGYRLILVITGKGQRTRTDEFGRPRRGVLKAGVPEWLRSGALSGLILHVTQAHPKHGGDGAFYVCLRRRR